MSKENMNGIELNKVEVVKGSVDDAKGIQALVREASKGMYRLCGWSDEEIDSHFDPRVIEDGANKLKDTIATFTEANILFVAKDENDTVIGCCFANKEENVNRVEAVYVMELFQGTGLAKKIYNAAYEQLDHEKDTFLDVFSLNSKAINFYKKLGFSETGKKHFEKAYADSSGVELEITEMMLPGKSTEQ